MRAYPKPNQLILHHWKIDLSFRSVLRDMPMSPSAAMLSGATACDGQCDCDGCAADPAGRAAPMGSVALLWEGVLEIPAYGVACHHSSATRLNPLRRRACSLPDDPIGLRRAVFVGSLATMAVSGASSRIGGRDSLGVKVSWVHGPRIQTVAADRLRRMNLNGSHPHAAQSTCKFNAKVGVD